MSTLSKQTAILLGLQLAHGAANAGEAALSAFSDFSGNAHESGQDDPDLANGYLAKNDSDKDEIFGTSSSGFDAPNYIFTTLSSGVGDLSQWPDAGGATGVAAGDAICQAEATAAGLPGAQEYIAWLSDTQSDAYCRAHGLGDTIANNCGEPSLPTNAGPWRRLDNRFFGGRLPEIQDTGVPLRPIQFAPDTANPGRFLERLNTAYTGTTASGFLSEFLNCNDWSSDLNSDAGRLGNPAVFNADWSGSGVVNCAIARPLICLRPGNFPGGPTPPSPALSRRVFVTSSVGQGDLSQWPDAQGSQGLDAGDNICQAHAQRAGLDNAENYRVWLSEDGINAIDRLTTTTPLLTIDGERFVTSPQSLAQNLPEAALNLDENGTVIDAIIGDRVWTGTGNDGIAIAGLNCGGWQTADLMATGVFGTAGSYTQWSVNSATGCDAFNHLYCFADFEDDISFGSSFEEFETFTP